jgi:hypothetical protein
MEQRKEREVKQQCGGGGGPTTGRMDCIQCLERWTLGTGHQNQHLGNGSMVFSRAVRLDGTHGF